jgi:hypothetical protein
MSRRPTAALMLRDITRYLKTLDVRFSPGAFAVFERIEMNGEQLDRAPFGEMFLLALLEASERFRSAVSTLGGDSAHGVAVIREMLSEPDDLASYETSAWYSSTGEQRTDPKLNMFALAVAIARAHARREVTETDVIEAVLRHQDEVFPAVANDNWTDERLHTTYNTLGHIAVYDSSLDVRFDEIRRYFEIESRELSPAEAAPPNLRGSVLRLLEEHPEYHQNCFVIMSFSNSPHHRRIFKTLCEVLSDLGFRPLRADRRQYSHDLLDNIMTHLHGCALAVAVHERIEREAHNPNVAFEIGYMFALRKPVCLLKERTVERLPSDLVGRLYVEFDIQRLRSSLRRELGAWLASANLL